MTVSPLAAALLLAVASVPIPAHSGEDGGTSGLKVKIDCEMAPSPNDRLSEKGDLIIPAGAIVEDAIAIEGDVIIKKGARLSGNAIALGGSVIAEPGAHIGESAISVGGKLQISSAATIKGTRIALSDSIQLKSEDGDDFQLSLNIDGDNLGHKLVNEILRDLRACRDQRQADAGR